MENQPQEAMQDRQMKDLKGVQTKRSSDDSMEELFALWLVEGPSSEESCYFSPNMRSYMGFLPGVLELGSWLLDSPAFPARLP